MDRALKVAIVGCGAVAELYYAPALRELERRGAVAVGAVVDPDAGRRQVLHAAFPAALALAECGQLRDANVDLAVVCSPPRFHAEQAIMLVEGGTPVLCEKPLATSVEDAERMVAAGERCGTVLAVAMVRRHFPAAQAVKEALAHGVLGRVERFHFAEGGKFHWPAAGPSLFLRETAGGGVFMDIGIHALDLLLWWLGEPQEVEYADDAMGGVEANSLARVRYDNGLHGTVRLSRDWSLPNRYVIEGERGWLAWKAGNPAGLEIGWAGGRFAVTGQSAVVDGTVDFAGARLPAASYEAAFLRQLLGLVRHLRGQGGEFVAGREALASLRLVQACYGSRRLLDMPWLAEDELAVARRQGEVRC